MKKQTKNILIISIVLIAFLSVGYFAVMQEQFGSGLTIFSMSPTSVISTNSDLRGIWWLVNTQTGGGQSVSGTRSPQELRNIDSGYLTKNSLSLEVSTIDEKINYNIVNTGDPIIKYQTYINKAAKPCETQSLYGADAPACDAGDYDNPIKAGKFLKFIGNSYVCERVCIKKIQTGVIGDINADRITHSATINLKNGLETVTKTITSDQSNADFINSAGELIGQVQYTSALWTGNFAPSSANLKAFYNTYNTKQWTITSAQKVIDYKSQKSSFESWASQANVLIDNLDLSSAGTDINKQLVIVHKFIQDKVDSVNNYALKIEQDDLSITMGQTWQNRGDTNSGKVVINNPVQIANIGLLFRIRADWLGIVINPGQPSIVSVPSCNFKSGDVQELKVGVKNTGASVGNFKAYIECPNIKQTYTTVGFPFAVGETKDLSIIIDANNKGALTDSCKITVTDTNLASATDSKSLSCTVQVPATCQVGQVSVVGQCVKGCDDITGTVKQLFCCSVDQTVERDLSNVNQADGGYYCKDKNESEPLNCKLYQTLSTKSEAVYGVKILGIGLGKPTIVSTPQCKTADWFFLVIFLIFVGIFGLLMFIIYLSTKKVKRRRK